MKNKEKREAGSRCSQCGRDKLASDVYILVVGITGSKFYLCGWKCVAKLAQGFFPGL